MGCEVNRNAYLGIVLIALASIFGICFGIYSILTGSVGGEYIAPVGDLIPSFSFVTKISFLICVISLIEGFLLIYKNYKFKIWDNSRNEHQNIITDCDLDIYEDFAQVRIPNQIGFIEALICKLSSVSHLYTIGFGNVKTVNITGVVKTQGNFYVIGSHKLARGLVLLNDGDLVDLRIKTKVTIESALGIYRIFDVI